MKVEFFSRSLKSKSIEGYTQNDLAILRNLYPNLTLSYGAHTFLKRANIVVSWWVTGSILPLLKVKFFGGKLVVIAGGNDCQLVKDSKSREYIGYGNYPVLKRLIVRYVLSNADKVLVVSKYMLNRLIITPSQLEVAYNACSNVTSHEFIEKKRIFTSVLNFDKDSWNLKRGFLLLEAFARFRRDHEWKLVLIGKYNDHFCDIESKILELGLSDSVDVHFDVPNLEVLAMLKSTGVYVQLSDIETFGMSVLEAMSNKCLIVSSFMGALPELLKGQGIYVNHNCVHSIYKGLIEASDLFDNGISKNYQMQEFTLKARSEIIEKTLKNLM